MAKHKVRSAYEITILSQVNSAAIQRDTLRGSFSVIGRIFDAVKSILANLPGLLTPEIKAEIEAAACAVFDELVKLPEPLDALSDRLFKSALEHFLGG